MGELDLCLAAVGFTEEEKSRDGLTRHWETSERSFEQLSSETEHFGGIKLKIYILTVTL